MDSLFDVELAWDGPLEIRESQKTGAEWVRKWHYSELAPSVSVCYGAFCPDMIAVVAIGHPAGNASGVAGKLGLQNWRGNLEITRVVCHPDAPKNTASKTIAATLRYVHAAREVDWVFSYADTGQNHHGGIYQALNAVYVGLNGKSRKGYLFDGKRTHPKTLVNAFGTEAWPRVRDLAAARGQLLEKVEGQITPKHCYILPCSTPAVNREIRRALAEHEQPYPKRVAE